MSASRRASAALMTIRVLALALDLAGNNQQQQITQSMRGDAHAVFPYVVFPFESPTIPAGPRHPSRRKSVVLLRRNRSRATTEDGSIGASRSAVSPGRTGGF